MSQWGWDYPTYEMENKIHVPNHEPVADGQTNKAFPGLINHGLLIRGVLLQ